MKKLQEEEATLLAALKVALLIDLQLYPAGRPNSTWAWNHPEDSAKKVLHEKSVETLEKRFKSTMDKTDIAFVSHFVVNELSDTTKVMLILPEDPKRESFNHRMTIEEAITRATKEWISTMNSFALEWSNHTICQCGHCHNGATPITEETELPKQPTKPHREPERGVIDFLEELMVDEENPFARLTAMRMRRRGH